MQNSELPMISQEVSEGYATAEGWHAHTTGAGLLPTSKSSKKSITLMSSRTMLRVPCLPRNDHDVALAADPLFCRGGIPFCPSSGEPDGSIASQVRH